MEKLINTCGNIPCDVENSTFGETGIYDRLIFSTPEPNFIEYKLSQDNCSYELLLEEDVKNELYIWEIQKGEVDFVKEYLGKFRGYEIIKNVSLGNSKKPFEYALEHDRHYIDTVYADCVFDEDICRKKKKVRKS